MQIKINEQEFELKYTIESWKKLKEKDITPVNIQSKLNEDFAGVISFVIYFGLKVEDRDKVTIEQLDTSFGFDVIDIVMPALMDSMPKSVKDASEKAISAEKK